MGTRLYDITPKYAQTFLLISIDECVKLCKQEPTCEAVTFRLNENSQICYPFKPNRYASKYDAEWGSWFKENTSSSCQTQSLHL